MLPPNVLIIVLDDVGVDQVSPYGFPASPPTPTLQALADEGLRFDQAWATPVCSPTRAALMTGRFADRTTVGAVIMGRDTKELPESELTLPEMLDASGVDWSSVAVGKWHLASRGTSSGVRHPWRSGFDRFSGTIGNLSGESYDAWTRIGWDGERTSERTFSTTRITDDAIEALGDLPEPFLLYVAYHAAHVPLMVPPQELLGDFPVDPRDPRSLYAANVVAADHEIGRLLDAMSDRRGRTLVVVLGDNGTPHAVDGEERLRRSGRRDDSARRARSADGAEPGTTEGMEGSKGSFTEGGLRVPLIVSGPPVAARGRSDALVSVVDLFPTLAELAGSKVEVELDGVSLVPLLNGSSAAAHEVLYSELRHPPDGPPWERVTRAARDQTLKVVDQNGTRSYYRLDGFDEQEVRRARLTAEETQRIERLGAEIDRHGR